MNVIFQFKPTAPFTESEQKSLDKANYSQIPEMRIIEEVSADNPDTVLKTIPYQATINEADFDSLLVLLETKGTVTIIGKWNDDGSLISYDKYLYRDALNDVVTYETAVFLDGVDYTGKEGAYIKQPLLDENGKEVLDAQGNVMLSVPGRRTFVRVKSKKRPTLTQAKNTPVNIFAGTNLRQL